jgi:ATP phosphoribosyltransferase regulatory subunit
MAQRKGCAGTAATSWGDAPALRAAIASLRARGETEVCVLPGHEDEIDEFHCDRELTEAAGQWVIQAI